MKIYLVRHSQTEYNVLKITQGWSDSPLTKLGIAQAKKAGSYLKDVDFKVAFTSDSNRAISTLKHIIADRDIDIVVSDQLREMNFGVLEGKPYIDNFYNIYYQGFVEYNGETKEMVSKRVADFLKTQYDEYKDDNVLVVSHGWAIRSFLRSIDEKRLDDYYNQGNKLKNCSTHIVEYDGNDFVIKELFIDVLD